MKFQLTQIAAMCSNPIPFSIIQHIVNGVFYSRDDGPINHIGTLSSEDTLLAKALLTELKKTNHDTQQFYEIGPGNFNFAKTMVSNGFKGAYNCIDFLESSYRFAKDDLARLGIKFTKDSIENAPNLLPAENFSVSLCEVLDDTYTEFFTFHQGLEHMMVSVPTVIVDENVHNRKSVAIMQAAKGDFSITTQSMANSTEIAREYTPREIVSLLDNISPASIAELMTLHPGWIRNIDINNVSCMPFELKKLGTTSWQGVNPEHETYRSRILERFREQLKSRPDEYLHIPIAGINLMLSLMDRKNFRIDFFDYGYDASNIGMRPYSLFNHQITVPVNFELLAFTGELLGYEVRLEKNREFVKRNLGFETIPLGYVYRTISDKLPQQHYKQVFHQLFAKHVLSLQPEATVNADNIVSFRIPLSQAEMFLTAFKERFSDMAKRQFEEASYHLELRKN